MKPTCIVCGAEFENTCNTSKKDYLSRKYCSRSCSNKNTVKIRSTLEAHKKVGDKLRGRPKTLQHRQNLSRAIKTSPKAIKLQFKKGKENIAYGRNQTGETNHNWKGGATSRNQQLRNNPQMSVWRNSVFTRDKYTCQKCGLKGGYLQAHHIIPVSKREDLIFDIDNGLTVCLDCHEKIHGRPIGGIIKKNIKNNLT